jgi:hypothetical protein
MQGKVGWLDAYSQKAYFLPVSLLLIHARISGKATGLVFPEASFIRPSAPGSSHEKPHRSTNKDAKGDQGQPAPRMAGKRH